MDPDTLQATLNKGPQHQENQSAIVWALCRPKLPFEPRQPNADTSVIPNQLKRRATEEIDGGHIGHSITASSTESPDSPILGASEVPRETKRCL